MKAMKMKSAMKAMKMKSAMKMKAMKVMKVASMKMKKAKKVSKVGRYFQVLKGTREKTKGGLRKEDLTKNKNGKVVSKKRLAQGKKNKFAIAVSKARKTLGCKGFVPIGGKSAQGQALLKKARSFYK